MELPQAIYEPFSYFLDPKQRLYWLHIVGALAIALVAFIVTQGRQKRLVQFFGYCFPKRIWTHRSTLNDIAFFLVNRVVFFVLFAPCIILIYPTVNYWIFEFLGMFGPPQSGEAPYAVLVIYGLLTLAVFDLSIYLAHLALHKSPFLWRFHKVHHSAETLTPFTAYRLHPVDDLLTASVGALGTSVAHAAFSYFWSDSFSSLHLTITGLTVLVFYMFGYNLRHSHIWVSYPRWLSGALISPAQHQIHHSVAPEHRDKNLGFIFSVWDRWFGTLYVPQHKEALTFGLSDGSSARYHNPLSCYLRPFAENLSNNKWKALAAVTVTAGISAVSVGSQNMGQVPEEVFLERLTTNEVRSRIDSGYRTVIVPTGGVEQNGKHVVLGKHNYVVAHAAKRIAHELGQTLVAPVVAHVPEGEINPPEGHMQFAGTISMRESTFKAILEDTARSLIQHGFRRVLFIGDSGSSQAAQRDVAQSLSEEYADRQVSIIHVGAYYDQNGQVEWLQENGYSMTEIGRHAGMRDSSEMLYVAPETIRRNRILLSERYNGVDGAYWKANEAIGKAMLELKIKAALRFIHQTAAD